MVFTYISDLAINIIYIYPSIDAVLMLEEFLAIFRILMLALVVTSVLQYMKLVMHLVFGMSRVVLIETNMSPFIHIMFTQEKKITLRRKIKVMLIHWGLLMILVVSCTMMKTLLV